MAYLSSPIWLLFLLFSPILFIGDRIPVQNTVLFISAMCLLLIPKALAAERMIFSPEHRRVAGSAFKIIWSVVGETVYSMLLAPILMLFYTQFVYSSFFGGSAGWGRQQRTDEEGPSWRQCEVVHAAHTLLAILVGGVVAWWLPAMLPGLMLVLIGPIVSIPFSYLLAANKMGRLAQRHGWFLIPEETQLPPELQPLAAPLQAPGSDGAPGDLAEDFGLARTVLDPRVNALHVSLLRERQHVPLHAHERLKTLCEKLLLDGPAALQPREKKILLWDADSMLALHQQLWGSSSGQWHSWWREAFDNYLHSLPQSSVTPSKQSVAA